MTGRTPRPWQVLVAAALSAGVSQAFGRFAYSLLLTEIREDLDLSYTVAGFIGSANLAAYLVGTLVVSAVVTRIGLSRMTRAGVIGVVVGLGALSWGPNVGVVLAALVLTGFSGASVWITAPGLAAGVFGPERRGLALGLVGSGIGIGIVVSSVLSTTIGENDWRSVYRVLAVIGLVAVVLSNRWLRGGSTRTGRTSGLDAMRLVPQWKRLIGSYGAFGFGMAMFLTFLVSGLEEDHGYSTQAASLAFSLVGVGSVLGGVVFGPMADRIGRSRTMVVGYAVMASTAIVVQSGARPWAWIASFLFGVAFTGQPTSVAARISDHVDAERFGAAFGVATLSFGVGLVAGPQLGGVIGDVTGSFRLVFVLVALAAAVGAVLGWERAEERSDAAAVTIDGSSAPRRSIGSSSRRARRD